MQLLWKNSFITSAKSDKLNPVSFSYPAKVFCWLWLKIPLMAEQWEFLGKLGEEHGFL